MDRIQADHRLVKKLGHWTTDRAFEVRARRGAAVLDLRSHEIPDGDLEVRVDLDHAMLKLLVPEGAVIDSWDLRWSGRRSWAGAHRRPERQGQGLDRAARAGGAADPADRLGAYRRGSRPPRRHRDAVGDVLPRLRRRLPRSTPHRLAGHGDGPQLMRVGYAEDTVGGTVGRAETCGHW